MQVTKATGQNQEQIAAGFAVLGGAIPLSSKAMGKLGLNMIDLSQEWGIQTTSLMRVLEKNTKTLSRLDALGGDTQANAEAIANVISRAGVKHEKAVSMLAEKFAFKGGGDDLMKAVVQMGGRQDLVQRMRTEDMSEGLLMEINKAVLATYDQQVMKGTEDRFIRSLTAQGLTFDLEQISALRSLQESYTDAENLREQGLKQQNVEFSQSLSTMFAELFAPVQEILIPILSGIAYVLTFLRIETGWIGKLLGKSFILWGQMMLVLKLIKLWQVREVLWTKIGAITGMSLGGAIALGIAAVGMTLVGMAFSDKKIAETKKRDEDERQKVSLQNRRAHERYIHKALMAASLINQSLANPVGERTNEMLERVRIGVENVNASIQENDGRRNPV